MRTRSRSRAPAGRRLSAVGGGAAEFTPASLPGLTLWLDPSQSGALYQETTGATATTPAATDGDPVGTWKSRDAAPLYLTAPSLAARPTLRIVGGRNFVRFDGVDDALHVLFGVALAQPDTVLAVYDRGRPLEFNGTPRQLYNPTTTKFGAHAGTTLEHATEGPAAGVYVTQSVVFNGASSVVWVNGALKASGNAGTLGMGGVTMMNNSSVYQAGDAAEMLVYAGALSDADRQSAENYLRSKWGTG